MNKHTRLDDIIVILKKQGYATVKQLTDELHYSTATINRDLNVLQKQKLVKRSYGGVELNENISIQLPLRYHKMKPVKNRIGKSAAEFIKDGDVIFVDGSTTAQFIAQYITSRKDLTVISNNMALLTYLSEFNIKCICLGGTVVEAPSMLCGIETEHNARLYRASKCFFSTGSIFSNGKIGTGTLYFQLHTTLIENSDEVFYLADHEKLDAECTNFLCDASSIDYVITDIDFSEGTRARYPKTHFVRV